MAAKDETKPKRKGKKPSSDTSTARAYRKDTKSGKTSKGSARGLAVKKLTGSRKEVDLFGLSLEGWLCSASSRPAETGALGRFILAGRAGQDETLSKILGDGAPRWQVERALKRRGEVHLIATDTGPVWLAGLREVDRESGSHGGLLAVSGYGGARDLAGVVAGACTDYGLDVLKVEFADADEDEMLGALVGLETGAYRYQKARYGNERTRPVLSLPDASAHVLSRAEALGTAINVARHLVNLPAGDLNPGSYADAIAAMFRAVPQMKVTVWDESRLKKENMGLMLAVGGAAAVGPRLVHLSYRPGQDERCKKPLAFVGKGITFDTGGLDIKPSGSMRLMKKDMGGSAALVGLAWWLAQSKADVPCDIYLALAENAVSSNAFRPGDVIEARSGKTVEIDNTDAEGRLVLADALDVAVTQKGANAPAVVVDLATLTGAMRVALGTKLAGMFSNDDQLADALLAAGHRRGDPLWRMPLYLEYQGQLKTTVADLVNCPANRLGGAITAALFLKQFVGETRWAHVDLFAWNETPGGALGEPGGSGQGVQFLAEFVQTFET